MHWYMKENKLPKGMPKREREALLSMLKEMLEIAEMKNTNFDGAPRPEVEFDPQKPTEYVRELTKYWRGSWLVSPLKKLIERYSQDDQHPAERGEGERGA